MSATKHVRAATSRDVENIRAVVSETLFPGDMLDDMMKGYFDGSSPEQWLVYDEGEGATGVAFFAPEPMTEGTWNLKAIGVRPRKQRTGAGRAMLRAVETQLEATGARLLVIDTSSTPDQAPARAFYEKLGYDLVATIPGFWGPDDDKVTFSKSF